MWSICAYISSSDVSDHVDKFILRQLAHPAVRTFEAEHQIAFHLGLRPIKFFPLDPLLPIRLNLFGIQDRPPDPLLSASLLHTR